MAQACRTDQELIEEAVMMGRKHARTILLAGMALVLSFASSGMGADWPMWRHDANRSAASPDELPARLHLEWRRVLAPPRPAFPEDPRLCADLSYEPVVLGNTLFLPSMVTDSLAAVDTRTGAERWRYFAGGPVRFAPVAWRARVYFASDDGWLRCLDASSGKLLWKVRGAPDERGDSRLLGNGRMVSRWPARGGPVLAGGVVYFGAGIWPFEGVYVCAVHAETGKVLWRNKDCGFIRDGLIDHGARRDGGLSPLGYLAVIGGKLVVPSGRALPGFLERKSGKMEPYTTGWGGRMALAKGCWHVAGIGEYLFQSGDLYGLSPGAAGTDAPKPKELLSPEEFARVAGVPLKTVEGWLKAGLLLTAERGGKRLIRAGKPRATTYVSLWMGKARPAERHRLDHHPRLQIAPANQTELGIFREPVITADAIYYSIPVRNRRGRGGLWPAKLAYDGIVAYDTTKPRWGLTPHGRIDARKSLLLWPTLAFEKLWTLASTLKVHIKAGPRLYAGGKGVVAAIDIPKPGGEPRVSWQATIAGTPHTMLAADDRLFVVTREGSLYCFGSAQTQPQTRPMKQPPAAAPADAWTRRAREMLEQTGVSEGYCLALGVGSGRLVEELARQSELHVVVVEGEAGRVDAARRKLNALGLYGTRVHILGGGLDSLRLSPHFASLAVAESVAANAGDAFVEQLFATLRPYGGVACLPLPQSQHAAFADSVRRAKLPGAELKRAGTLTLLTRAGALAGAADWTHENGGPGNTFASDDRRVKPPFAVLWFGGSVDSIFPAWDYTHCRGPFPLTLRGRLYALVENELHAADMYTGRHLWKAALAHSPKTKSRRRGHMVWQRETAENFVAAPEGLYVVHGGTCVRLDPATGAKRGQVSIPARLANGQAARWREVRVWQDHLVGTAGKLLLCLDRRSGKLLWQAEATQDRFSFALGDGKAFCIDYWPARHRRRGEGTTEQSTLAALDVRTGKAFWSATVRTPADSASEKVRKRFPPLRPWLSYCEESDILLLSSTRSILGAYRGKDGSAAWAKTIPCRDRHSNWSGDEPPILLPDVLIAHSGEVYDARTGERRPKRLWLGMNTAYNSGGARGCGRAVGNRHIVTLRDGDAAYFTLATGRETFLRGVRSGCTNSLLPAGGILNAPNFAHGCSCNWAVFTSFALVPMPEAAAWNPAPPPKPKRE